MRTAVLLLRKRTKEGHVGSGRLQRSAFEDRLLTGQLSSRRQVMSVRSMTATCGQTASASILLASSAMHVQAASRVVWLFVREQRT